MKKIIFVIPSMASGGAEMKAIILLNYFFSSDYSPTLVLFKKEGVRFEEIPGGINIIDLKKKHRSDFFKLIIKLGLLLRKEKPYKVISFIEYSNVITLIAKIVFHIKCEVIINEESLPQHYLKITRFKYIKKFLMFFLYRKADKIICGTEHLRDYICRNFRINKDRVIRIYNPINIERIHKLSKEKVNHPFLEKRKQGYKLIIAVGRLSKIKRYDVLLEAYAKIKKKIKALLVILGEGDLLPQLIEMKNILQLGANVDFVGYVSNPYAWISKSDLLLMTSQWEGFGNVIVEAMACETPVISSKCPFGPIEIISDGINGLLAPIGDAEETSRLAITLLKNNYLREKLRAEGKNRAEDFNIKIIGNEYKRMIETCI